MTTHKKQLVLIPGDGVGPEIFEAIRPLVARITAAADVDAHWREAGYGEWRSVGQTIATDVLALAESSDAVLFGAEDSEGYSWMAPNERPGSALLQLRKLMGGFSNLRPVRVFPAMEDRSPLRPEITHGVDILIVRELLGGLYFGQPRGIERTEAGARAYDTMEYTSSEIERVAHTAFALARQRKRRLCSVDKANVLACSFLWRETVSALASQYPDVELTHMYVDNCAIQLIRRPSQFDVILTENTFGDILSDASAVLAGSIGMLPSACIGATVKGASRGLYEPIHGSAPDIAGKEIANPVGTILSLAMALKYSLARPVLADQLEKATAAAIEAGVLTRDMGGQATTSQAAAGVVERLQV
jgi:3-isopropylmalate dehydrogenase